MRSLIMPWPFFAKFPDRNIKPTPVKATTPSVPPAPKPIVLPTPKPVVVQAPPPLVIPPLVTVVSDPHNIQLSAHFSYLELVTTEHREYIEINANDGMKYIENMRRLCNEVLEPIIALLGEEPRISSCFRSPALNTVIGGSKTSQHMEAGAADQLFKMPLKTAFNKIMASKIPYSQLIYEFGRWIHIGIIDKKMHPGKVGQNLVASMVNGKAVYSLVTKAI